MLSRFSLWLTRSSINAWQWIAPPLTVTPSGVGLYVAMSACFCTALIIANLTGAILIPLELPLLGSRMVSAGILSFPLTFLLTDLLNEFFGETGAKRVTGLGFVLALMVAGLFRVIDQLPIVPDSPIPPATYAVISKQFTGMLTASLTAYLIGQYLDIYVFALMRRLTKGRSVWLRATSSTLVSQLFDSYIVLLIAFWGTMPLEQILLIARSNYEVKILVAIGLIPLLALSQGIIRQFLGTHSPRAMKPDAV